MISVMNNNNFELDRRSDVVEYGPRTKPRVSEDNDSVVRSDGVADGAGANELRSSVGGSIETGISSCDAVDSSDTVPRDDRWTRLSSTRSEENRFSVMELENRAAENEKVGACEVDVSSTHSKKSGEVRVSESDPKGVGNIKAEDMKSKAGNSEGGHNGGSEQSEFRVGIDRINSVEVGGHAESSPRAIDDKNVLRNVKGENPGSREGNDPIPSMSDESEGSRSSGTMAVVGPSKPLGYGFEIGDMVWGKVKSHPWWPGQIFSEAFASNSVRRSKREGHVLVAFFGDSSYGWFELAELIPFGPNFSEKSRQTNSRTFVKAVEEAVDEVSRRCALGLACRCRNPYNFRPTDVQGYYAVDVGDYEAGIIYSAKQIKDARDSFQPKRVLDFIKQLAVTPASNEHVDINFIKNMATGLAYRKAVFEEFDETYAQAFGYQPVRPSREATQDAAQRLKVASRAPLSGPMVIAEALGKNKTSSKSSKTKDQSKKDKYLFKRRDEPINSVHPNPSAQPPVCLKGSSENVAGDFFLQKRPSTVSSKPHSPSKKEYSKSLPNEVASGSNHNLVEGLDQSQSQSDIVEISGQEKVQASDAKVQGEGGAKKAKVRKRPIGEQSADKSVPLKKKKKREKDLTGSNTTQMGASVDIPARKTTQVAAVPKEDYLLLDSTGTQQRSLTGYNKLELQQLLWDLQAFAVNHAYGETKNREAVHQVFSRFRALVYQKSAAVLPVPDDESNDPPRSSKSPAVTKEISPPSDNIKPPKPPPVRFDDATKSGRKRALSDRQEEKVVKKKKFNDVKQLAAEKRSSTQEKVKPELSKKSQLIPKVVADDPTMLVLKIPPGGNLPSGNELKARFARFGPLDHSGTRVFWKTSTCRVIYKHKIHAEAAYKFATGNNLFGNTNIICYLRDAGAAGPEPESSKIQKEDSPVRAPPPRPAAVPVATAQQAGVQLKSCLKKPGGDDAAVVTAGGNGGSKGTARVKFMLGGEDDGSNKYIFNNADGGSSSSSSTVMDFNSKNFQKVVPLFPHHPNTQKNIVPTPLLPPLLPRPNTQFTSNRPPPVLHNSQFIRPVINLPPPLPPPIVQFTRPPMPSNPQYTQNAVKNDHNVRNPIASSSSSSDTNVEFAQKMMSLLTKCNEVVTNVKDVLGYMPYHPL